jgi:UDP-galactopyranose mutase
MSEHEDTATTTIIAFCHLRWDFVYQRPQQLLSRLAQHYKVLFVEEPVFHDGPAYLRTQRIGPQLTVCQPHTPLHAPGFHDDQIPLLQRLLADIVPEGEAPVAWLYTPMALPLLQTVHPSLVVYDCMDELSAFKNAPKQLLQRETALLNLADVVFTGGPSLYEAKRDRHPNTHCFPSSVDLQHFSRALDRNMAHPSQQDLPHPRLGFYGVIDERLDLDLLATLAEVHPDWQLVMVGPVVKIDPASLPRHPNIHYMGQASYEELPRYLAAWDVCLLPFALNESTRFISPTKVLEYMVAELPIVSTAIADVATPYGHIVSIAHSHLEFVGACEAALSMHEGRRRGMADAMRAVVCATSWDSTVQQMRALLAAGGRQAVAGSGRQDGGLAGSASVNPLRVPATMAKFNCIVVGGGPTGLSAAYHLGQDTLLLDKNPSAGGWCRSIQDRGFTFDHAGHIMFSNDPYVLKLYDKLLGENVHWQNREAWVYSKQVYTRYPFQGALYGLPPEVITECIVGAIEARYGAAPAADGTPSCSAGKPVEDCCADGTADFPKEAAAAAAPVNFEDFIYKVWGAGIAKHFAIPYNRKLWTVPLSEMETSWLGGRVPLPDLKEIIAGALEPVGKPMGPNARFGYPLKGGFQALVSGFLPLIEGKVEQDAEVIQVLPAERTVALADGRRFRYDHLISTMPLPELVRTLGSAAPEPIRKAAKALKHLSIRCVNLGIKRSNVTDKHWIYYPEDTIFHRIFVQGNASPHCNPPGGFGLTCEISYSHWKPLPLDGAALVQRCIDDCIAVGLIEKSDEIIVSNQVDMPYAYVVYDHARAANVALIRKWLAGHDILLAGRYSEWEYYNSDHAFIAGKKAAETVLAARSKRSRSAAQE